MYLRRYDKKVDGADYGYWPLVESARTARGPRQRVVATIGKLPGLDKEDRIGWEEVIRIIKREKYKVYAGTWSQIYCWYT